MALNVIEKIDNMSKLDAEHRSMDEKLDLEGSAVALEHGQVEIVENDLAISKRLNRKFDLHLIPWLFGIWLFAFIDRSNIGNARIDGLAQDLHLTGTDYNVSLMVSAGFAF